MEANSWAWLRMSSIPALSAQRQAELWEFEATAVYIVSLGYSGLCNEAIPKQTAAKQFLLNFLPFSNIVNLKSPKSNKSNNPKLALSETSVMKPLIICFEFLFMCI